MAVPTKPFHLEKPEVIVVTGDPTTFSLACEQKSQPDTRAEGAEFLQKLLWDIAFSFF